jgi:hypothetical protein
VDAVADYEAAQGKTGEVGGEDGGGRGSGAAEDEREPALPKGFVDQGDCAGEEE